MHRATCLLKLSNHSPLNMSTGGPMFSWQLAHAARNQAQPAKTSNATVVRDKADLLAMMVAVITSSGNITNGNFIRLTCRAVGLPFVRLLVEGRLKGFLLLKGCLGLLVGLASAVWLPAAGNETTSLCAERPDGGRDSQSASA